MSYVHSPTSPAGRSQERGHPAPPSGSGVGAERPRTGGADTGAGGGGVSSLRGVSGAPTPADGDGPVRPNVVVSQCLGFAAVRYDGQVLESRFVDALRDAVNFVQVCPEVGMGLGVPRDPIRVEVVDGERRLVEPSTGRDHTERMRSFSGALLGRLERVDGFILKSRSPSCGLTDTKVFAAGGPGGPVDRGAGLFADAVRDRFPWAAVQDESRLTKGRHRHHFLTRLWALARLRRAEAAGTLRVLARYHTAHELLLTAYGRQQARRLGRLVADPDARAFPEVVADYRRGLGEALSRPARKGHAVKALQHAFRRVSDDLEPDERRRFERSLADARAGRLRLSGVLRALRSLAARFREPYPAAQRLLEPYPRALLTLSSSGDARHA